MENQENINWYKLFNSWEEAKEKLPIPSLQSYKFGVNKVCVIRNRQGIYALEDSCPHKMVPLSKGKLNEKGQVSCFWHQYAFDPSTGKEMTGKTIRDAKKYTLEETKEGLMVGIPDKPPMDEFSY